jgi:hypothetical protein
MQVLVKVFVKPGSASEFRPFNFQWELGAGILPVNYAFFSVLSEFSAIADKTRRREDLQG